MIEHALSPNKPIYLLGDSFGGSLALAVAARNPTLDLILILANPGQSFFFAIINPLFYVTLVTYIISVSATSYQRSPADPLISQEGHYQMFPYAISPLLGILLLIYYFFFFPKCTIYNTPIYICIMVHFLQHTISFIQFIQVFCFKVIL